MQPIRKQSNFTDTIFYFDPLQQKGSSQFLTNRNFIKARLRQKNPSEFGTLTFMMFTDSAFL